MLMICTYISVMYGFHYFSLRNVSWLLSYIMVSFSLVMIILVMTNSFLVSSSLRGAMVTLVSSRFGDCCCFLTIVITSVCSLYYSDVKQLVALSTRKNISWVFLILSIGDYVLAFVQLLVHAVRKCLLFTLVGDYISSSYGGQDKNQINTKIYGKVFGLVYLFVLLVGLSGFPFMGLYFRKHVFLDRYTNIGFFIICGFIMSCAYSVRLFIILFGYLSFSVYSLRVDFNMIGLVVMISSIVGKYMCFLIYRPYRFFSFLSFFVLFRLLFGVVVGVVVGCNYIKYRRDWLGYCFSINYFKISRDYYSKPIAYAYGAPMVESWLLISSSFFMTSYRGLINTK
ncbi:NADH dehydrogenase subunit 5 [Schistosoma japonicum]|nr:NADH dehydrogenase subunit 5 [Schistosoma japonicum]